MSRSSAPSRLEDNRLLIGQTLSHFRITAKLGEGGMGEVYRAEDTKLDREVAIKVLPEAVASDPDRLTRFEREARALAALDHPNIAAIFEVGEAALTRLPGSSPDSEAEIVGEKTVHFLVMQLAEGETLAERLARGPVPVGEAMPVALQIAAALEAAHEKGIIHRDLKPANVKVTEDGQVKVLDFGLAKAMETEPIGGVAGDLTASPTLTAQMTHTGMILGTAAYMSPEQAKGQIVDKRADIWAFGVVLFEMLTGKRLFAGQSLTEVLARVVERGPDFADLSADLPAQVVRVLRLCLRKDPKARLRDIGDARLELESALSEPEPMPGKDLPRSRRATWRFLAWGSLALLAGIALGHFVGRFGRTSSSSAVTRVEIGMPADQWFQWIDQVVAMSPDGRQLVYSTIGPLYLRSLDRAEAIPIPGTEGARSPFFSADGDWIAFWADGHLKKVHIGGGVPINLCPARSPYGATWTRDGRILFSQRYAGIFEVLADGGEPQLLIQLDSTKGEVAFYGPQLLPDGGTVLFTLLGAGKNWKGASIVAQRLDSGERRVLIEGGADGRYVPTGHLVFAHGSTVQAMLFDPKDLKVRGSPVPILEGVWHAYLWDSGASRFSFSATGSLAYIPESAPLQNKLVWVDRLGVEDVLEMPARMYQHPRLAPDGTRIVVDTIDAMDIWVYDLDRATMSRLTAEQAHLHPVWSADGSRIVFDANLGQSLVWKSADTAESPELLMTDRSNMLVPVSFSPDDRVLAFEVSEDYVSFDIAVLDLDGTGEPAPLIASPEFKETSPMFSPDGHWMAFVSDETGQEEVYVQPYPGPGRRWLISTGGGKEPVWSPTGRELFYRAGKAMMAVPVRLGVDFAAEKPQQLFEGRYVSEPLSAHPTYDVSHDGQRFLMIKTVAPTDYPKKIHLVLDWFEDLEPLVP
jgi:serine/threonine-protein kinase